ncbi:sensor domain-containing diguanylate cyclase [Pseudogulbenkiania ferrooxidans]|uniref:sensor domain-containing diguanylate cyclase n=1 Tax=Pseudogulbenkiania ferrooxidans TaxID=549169 RepID=UPI001F356DC7|nr:CHASE domain-containing protein [Pseudogulbenkiania ferrooxidans]
MPKQTVPTPGRPLFRALPWLILIVGVALTALQAQHMRTREAALARAKFEIRVTELVSGFEHRMIVQAQILRGVAGLFAASAEVERDEFRRYVQGLELPRYYPGITGIGYVAIVPARDKARHVAAMRAQGFADYDIRPPGPRDPYTAVIYVEPFDWRNRRALGFDMSLEPTRFAVARRAADEGRALMTGKLTLLQETRQDAQPGVLLFQPVYRAGAPLASVAERRAALLGWAYSPLRVRQLLERYLQSEYPQLSSQIALQVYAGDTLQPAAQMYQLHPGAAAQGEAVVRRASLHGSTWTFRVEPLAGYWGGEAFDGNARIVLASGIVLTLLLVAASQLLGRSHQRLAAALREASLANRHLAEQQSLLRAIYDSSSVALFLMKPDGKIAHANQRMAAMFHTLLPELIGRDYDTLLPPAEQDGARDWQARVSAQQGTPASIERCYRRFDGGEFWGVTTGCALHDAGGRVLGIVGVIEDVTERHKNEAGMRLASTVFMASPTGIMVTDAEERIVSVNPAFTLITGYSAAEIIGQTPKILASGQHDADFYQELWRSIGQDGFWEGELLNRHKQGHLYLEMISISRVVDGQGRVVNYVGMFQDVTERRQAEERIRHLAHHDYLTGLPNRAHLLERASQALALARRYQRRLAILFLDLDRFKPINDRYGHDVGDVVLRTVADRLLALVRESDTVCRLGGDEFVILLAEYHDFASVEQLAHTLRTAIEQPCEVGALRLAVSASIGIATYPEHGDSVGALIQRADAAMYRAKTGAAPPICIAGEPLDPADA